MPAFGFHLRIQVFHSSSSREGDDAPQQQLDAQQKTAATPHRLRVGRVAITALMATRPTTASFRAAEQAHAEYEVGVLRLYRGAQRLDSTAAAQGQGPDPAPVTVTSESTTADGDILTTTTTTQDFASGTVVALLGVPGYISTQDLLAFLGPASDALAHLRVLRDARPSRYVVLAKLRSAAAAEEFRASYNGAPFNAFDPKETCHVVVVKSIEFEANAVPSYALPTIVDDPIMLFFQDGEGKASSASFSSSAAVSATASARASPVAVELAERESGIISDLIDKPNAQSQRRGLIELPTCPVCLERMDSTATGLVTTLCHHSYHCSCLMQWDDEACPVCRYTQKDDDPSGATSPTSECFACETTENLWICLICGNIGCGRYRQGHAHAHFLETSHVYALELETQRVWDYAADGYVHRLIQNKSDGKLVEFPPGSGGGANNRDIQDGDNHHQHNHHPTNMPTTPKNNRSRARDFDFDYTPPPPQTPPPRHRTSSSFTPSYPYYQEKIELISQEYSRLMVSQLESQRVFYEAQIAQLSEATAHELSILTHQLSLYQAQLTDFGVRVETLEKEKSSLSKKYEKSLRDLQDTRAQLAEEHAMSASLILNQKQLGQQVADKTAKAAELEEMNADLLKFIEMRDVVEKHDELKNGSVGISAASDSGSSKKRATTGRGRAKM